jgi:hypothetical protein
MIKMKHSRRSCGLEWLTVVLYTKTSLECSSIKSHDRIGIAAVALVRDVSCIMCDDKSKCPSFAVLSTEHNAALYQVVSLISKTKSSIHNIQPYLGIISRLHNNIHRCIRILHIQCFPRSTGTTTFWTTHRNTKWHTTTPTSCPSSTTIT